LQDHSSAPFGTVLRQFRLASGLSQEALAERARMSADGIGALERGVRRSPQRQTVALLAAALGLSEADRGRLEVAAAGPPRGPRRQGDANAAGATHDHHNLPLSLTSFLGRERESARIGELIIAQRLVTLTGVGGVGKTRLALEIANGLTERFADGVWLVECAPLADPTLLSARVATTLGVRHGFETAPNDTWIEALTEKSLLVVFDNCEHLLPAAAALSQRFLELCPHVHILATSREALRVPGERIYLLNALDLPRPRRGELPSLEELRNSPAIKMFFDRARHAAPDFNIGEDEDAQWRSLHSVCTRLDAMPLAIELAAARMNAMSLQTLATALDRRFDLLKAGSRTLPRHQTLRALLDWSYDLLAEDERRVLRRLSVFAGGWTLGAAESVCRSDDVAASDILAIIASLVDKSLIVADTTRAQTRYGMLETTRAYAMDQLIEHGEHDAVSRSHALYCLQLLQEANAVWGTPSISAWLAPLELELDNFRAAMQWSLVGQHDAALASHIAKAQYSVLELLSLFAEAVQWCERALAALGPDPDPKLEAPLQVLLAKFYSRGGYAADGFRAGSRAIELYRGIAAETKRSRDRAALAIALALTGRNLAFLGRTAEASRIAKEAVAAARDAGDPGATAWALYVTALTADENDLDGRRAVLLEALEFCRSSPDSLVVMIILLGLGHAAFDARDFASARDYAQRALDQYRRDGLNEDMAIWSHSLNSVAALSAGDTDLAYADAKEALVHARPWLDISCAIQVAAHVSAARGRFDVAARIIGASDVLFPETPRAVIPITRILHDRTLAQLRETVGEANLAAWLAEGRRWRFEELVSVARSL
jgi:predicted ATPase/DNA-binding XRE family transcriptional regulator